MADEIKIVRWQGGDDGERLRVSCGGNPDAMLVHPWGDPGLHDAEVVEGRIAWHFGRLDPLCVTPFGYGPRPCRCGLFDMVGLFQIVEGEGEDAQTCWIGDLSRPRFGAALASRAGHLS